MELILDQLSEAVSTAINGAFHRQTFVLPALHELAKLEIHSERLAEITSGWCSMICENRPSDGHWENHPSDEHWKRLLLICLEAGFRHLDLQSWSIKVTITATEHQWLFDVVFKSQDSEVIADLLHALTIAAKSHGPAQVLLYSCAGHLIGLHNLVPFSPRLRRLVIRTVEVIGYTGFGGVRVERFIELLDHLHVTFEDMDEKYYWGKHLLDINQFAEGTQCLSNWYWELLVELAVSESRHLRFYRINSLQIVEFLTEAEEWSRLECWMGIIWMLSPQEASALAEGDLDHSMLLLSHQRPGAVQKLERWMEQWSSMAHEDIPEPFKQMCKQARETTKRDTR